MLLVMNARVLVSSEETKASGDFNSIFTGWFSTNNV